MAPNIDKHGSHKPKEVRRFYEPLAVLFALLEQNKTKPRSTFSTSAHGINIKQRRRDFVDAIAHISTNRKGQRVAVAMEQQPDGLIVRIAGTGDIETVVMPFLNGLLGQLAIVMQHSSSNLTGDLHDKVFRHLSQMVLDFSQTKILAHYMKVLQDIAPICLPQINAGLNGKTEERLKFKNWFMGTFYKDGAPLVEKHMGDLARQCFHAQQTGLFDIFKLFLFQGYENVTEFEKFHKQLRRISSTIDMTLQFLDSGLSLRQDLANGIEAHGLPPSPTLQIPLLRRKLTLEGIAHRMFSDSSSRDMFLQELHEISPPGLSQTLVRYSETVTTEVHPELIIVNYFDGLSTGGFLDNGDKYIGCTKPSCLLCDIFISNHPAKYSRISSTSDVCLNWRLPDISKHEHSALARVETQRSILRKLVTSVRERLEETVSSQWMQQGPKEQPEPEWASVVDDDFGYNSRPLTPIPERSEKNVSAGSSPSSPEPGSEETSRPNREEQDDDDERDTVLFKGRRRF